MKNGTRFCAQNLPRIRNSYTGITGQLRWNLRAITLRLDLNDSVILPRYDGHNPRQFSHSILSYRYFCIRVYPRYFAQNRVLSTPPLFKGGWETRQSKASHFSAAILPQTFLPLNTQKTQACAWDTEHTEIYSVIFREGSTASVYSVVKICRGQGIKVPRLKKK